MSEKAGRAEYKEVVTIAKKFAEVKYPIIIRRRKIAEDGYCTLTENKFIIQINRNLPYYVAMEVVLHETAHAMAWNKDKDDHGPNWGRAYSKIYRVFLRVYYDKK